MENKAIHDEAWKMLGIFSAVKTKEDHKRAIEFAKRKQSEYRLKKMASVEDKARYYNFLEKSLIWEFVLRKLTTIYRNKFVK